MIDDLVIRSYRSSDAKMLGMVFHRAVHEVACKRYSTIECTAWSPEPPVSHAWATRLGQADTLVAETQNVLVGFMSLVVNRAYLDFAFVAPEVAGKGVASALYAVLEGRARARGLTQLTTEASLLAEPFFKRQGWRLVERQEVERRGVLLKNAVMQKDLKVLEEVA